MESVTAKKYRKRIAKEKNWLNKRTSVFLVTCGILLTTFGFSDEVTIRFIISIIGIFTTIFWIVTSRQSYKLIGNLTGEYRKEFEEDAIEHIVQISMPKAKRLHPAYIFATLLPYTFFIAWIVLLILHLLKLVHLLILF